MGVKKGEKNLNYPKIRKSRYYKTPYNEALKDKDRFTIPETQSYVDALFSACGKYTDSHSESQCNGYKHTFGNYVLSLDNDFDIKACEKRYFADFYGTDSGKKLYITPVAKDLLLVYFQLNNKYRWNTELEFISSGIYPFLDKIQNFRHLILPFLTGEKDIHKSRLITTKSINNGNEIITIIDFDTDNTFIQDLLIEYQMQQYGMQPRIYQLEFFKRFAESLDNILPTDIYDFNVNTLLKQETFFASLERREPELENRYFYRFIIQKQGSKRTITSADGVSIAYLMSESFAKTFTKGFRYFPFNPNESYPSYDKWAISTNGLEEKTAHDKPGNIKCIDFTRITTPTIKDGLKAWFWGEAKAGFENRYRNVLYIIEFFEYRDNLRKMYFDKFIQARAGTDLNIENTILSEEIILYTSEWNEKVTDQTYRSRIVPLKLFLQYMNENNIYKTELSAFEYLSTPSNSGRKSSAEIMPVPKADFEKLIKVLEEKSKKNNLHMLYYIAFCLNTLTPLRISSILDLDYNCVVEKGSGIYAVNVKVKTSDGDEKIIQISKEIKRLIDVAVSLTAATRTTAPEQFKHYLFLVNNQKNIYKSIPHRSYNKHLQNCCEEVGIALISAQNLRKTYYTNLVENAIKNNVSLLSLKELTGHVTIDTTETHYVKENIRNYLEATMGVEIGNMPIVGTVAIDYPEAKHEDLVNEECGYCRNPECNILGTANCLMCKGFITTPKHIEQFKEAITVLNKKIIDNPNPHDKEHLYAIKRLYVAYIEQLYIRKEEITDVTNN